MFHLFIKPELIVFAVSFDFTLEKILDVRDLADMMPSNPGVVPEDEVMSFVEADVVAYALDQCGKGHYITSEVSYRVGIGKVERAIRNAKFLQELTGKESHAVVAGNYINESAEVMVKREDIRWYQMNIH